MTTPPMDAVEEWALDPTRRAQAIEAVYLLESLALEFEGEFDRDIPANDLIELFEVTPTEVARHMRDWVDMAVSRAKEGER